MPSNSQQFVYRCKDKKENPREIVSWLRSNFGERGHGWDFYLTSGNITVEIWNDRYITMYQLWKSE